MATIKMMQGDSYVVFFALTLNQTPLTPDMVDDVEVCVGEALRKTLSSGSVGYDTETEQWYMRPSQAETMAMEVNAYEVIARVKFGDDVKGIVIGRIIITDTHSEEVI